MQGSSIIPSWHLKTNGINFKLHSPALSVLHYEKLVADEKRLFKCLWLENTVSINYKFQLLSLRNNLFKILPYAFSVLTSLCSVACTPLTYWNKSKKDKQILETRVQSFSERSEVRQKQANPEEWGRWYKAAFEPRCPQSPKKAKRMIVVFLCIYLSLKHIRCYWVLNLLPTMSHTVMQKAE